MIFNNESDYYCGDKWKGKSKQYLIIPYIIAFLISTWRLLMCYQTYHKSPILQHQTKLQIFLSIFTMLLFRLITFWIIILNPHTSMIYQNIYWCIGSTMQFTMMTIITLSWFNLFAKLKVQVGAWNQNFVIKIRKYFWIFLILQFTVYNMYNYVYENIKISEHIATCLNVFFFVVLFFPSVGLLIYFGHKLINTIVFLQNINKANQIGKTVKLLKFLRGVLVGAALQRVVLWGYVTYQFDAFTNWDKLFNEIFEYCQDTKIGQPCKTCGFVVGWDFLYYSTEIVPVFVILAIFSPFAKKNLQSYSVRDQMQNIIETEDITNKTNCQQSFLRAQYDPYDVIDFTISGTGTDSNNFRNTNTTNKVENDNDSKKFTRDSLFSRNSSKDIKDLGQYLNLEKT